VNSFSYKKGYVKEGKEISIEELDEQIKENRKWFKEQTGVDLDNPSEEVRTKN
jgi:hypothetical protein